MLTTSNFKPPLGTALNLLHIFPQCIPSKLAFPASQLSSPARLHRIALRQENSKFSPIVFIEPSKSNFEDMQIGWYKPSLKCNMQDTAYTSSSGSRSPSEELGTLNFVLLADENQPDNNRNNNDRGTSQQAVKEIR